MIAFPYFKINKIAAKRRPQRRSKNHSIPDVCWSMLATSINSSGCQFNGEKTVSSPDS